MTTVVAILLMWAVIAIPFSCLAYAIFLVKENSVAKYASVYKRAAIFFGLFLLILFGYFYVPGLMARMDRAPEVAVEGRYLNPNVGDTMTIANGVVTVRNGKIAKNNTTGTYTLTHPDGTGISADLQNSVHAIFGGPTGRYNRMISMSWTDSTNVWEAEKKNRSKKKGSYYIPAPVNRVAQWWIEIKGNDLVLINPVNTTGQLRFIKL
jgi:hypothetical protein